MPFDLSVGFCGVRFLNPFVVASSPSTDSVEMIARAFEAGWAGAVLKTTTTANKEVSLAYPIITSLKHGRRLTGFHNIDLISERAVEPWAEDVRQLKRDYPQRVVIASIVGDTKEEWQYLARHMASAGVFAILKGTHPSEICRSKRDPL